MTRTFFFTLLLLFFTATLSADTFRLEDDKLLAEFDATGRLIRLENKTSGKGNVIDRPGEAAFNMVCKKGQNWEAVVFPDRQQFKAVKDGNTVRTVIEKVKIDEEPNELTVTLTATLANGTLTFGAEIDNRHPGLTVVEFRYPRVAVVKSLGGEKKPDLLWPRQTGLRIPNFGMNQNFSDSYPGMASMQWMALTDDKETLYFSGRDAKIHSTVLHAGSGDGAGLSFTRFLFVQSGERQTVPETIVRLYRGTWHAAAEEYRNWASTWRKVRPRVDWVRDMSGYFLVINKQQYGDEMWPYDTLPKLYELAKSHGFDTLGLFGWYEGGHDNTYPDIEVGKTLGGAETLRNNIKKVQAAGGRVTLYVQGHLIDPTTEFYRNHGRNAEAHSHWGSPYYEHYNKSSRSEFLARYTTKVFSTACSGQAIWQDRMLKYVEFIHGFGADGVLYDQIGGMPPRPCFNVAHAHPNPGLSHVPGRLDLLDKIYSRTRKTGENFAFFTEHITDAYSQYTDVLHGINERPEPMNFSEMFRYTFPETLITVRNPAPHISSAFTNYAAAYGFIMEMEIRYRDDCRHVLADRSADQRNYARKVSELRKKYRDVLRRDRFVDETPLKNGNPAVICKAFEAGDRLGVVLWNPKPEPQKPMLGIPGYRLVECAEPERPEPKTSLPETIPASRIVIAVYEKAPT